MSKKAIVYLNNDASALLKIIGNRSHDEQHSLTGSLHLLVDALIDSMPKLPLTVNHLLFCCEHAIKTKSEEKAETLESAFSLLLENLDYSLDEIHLEKYRADDALLDRIKAFSNIEKLTLLFLIRWFRLGEDVRINGMKNLYQSPSLIEWAIQFIKSGD